MHAHRIDVLHVADADTGVGAVAHHLPLELLPAEEGALDEDLPDRRCGDAARAALAELGVVVGEAAAGAAERICRPDDDRVADRVREGDRAIDRVRSDRFGHRLADLDEQLLERRAVLGGLDRLERRAEQLHAVGLEDPGVGEGDREIQSGLAAECREEAIGPLLGDDPLKDLDGERLDIGDIRDAGVGHDRRRVRVHQDRLDPFLAERAAGLRPGVVEFGGLADEDRPGADEQDLHRTDRGPVTTVEPPRRGRRP